MRAKKAALHLASECGELTQAVVKWLQDAGRMTRYQMEMEAGDVLALIDLLREQGVIRNEQVHDRQQEKLAFYRRKYG
jgi:NTP pyrophosphatase (non-canonical NTP hydrolase)